MTDTEQRMAAPGELCTCGRQAALVFLTGQNAPTGWCGFSDGGAAHDGGTCAFCGDAVDHAHYARAEHDAGRDPGRADSAPYDARPQDGSSCPLYRLRMTDPPPELPPASVRRYDAAVDRQERYPRRLEVEVFQLLVTAGLAVDGNYALTPDLAAGETYADPPTDDLEGLVWDLVYTVQHVLAHDEHHVDTYDPEAGQKAVAVLMLGLYQRLDEAGVTPNPLAGYGTDLTAHDLIEEAGGDVAWRETVAHDRPLLIARRVVRRALDPEVPTDIYREWFVYP